MSKAKTTALSTNENYSQRQPLYIWPSVLGKRLRFGSAFWTLLLAGALVSKTNAFHNISKATASVTHSLNDLFKDEPENKKLAAALPAITAAYKMDTLHYGDNKKLDVVIDTAKTAEGFMHGMTAVLGKPLSTKEVFEKRKANEADYQNFVTKSYQERMNRATPDTSAKVEAQVSPIRGVDFDQLFVNSGIGARNMGYGSTDHKGVDFKAAAGAELQSPVSGTIKDLSYSKKSGGCVIIQGDDGSEHTFYHVAHLMAEKAKGKKQKRLLQEGQRIEAGDLFGKVGKGSNAGRVWNWRKMAYVYLNPHCHWEVRMMDKHGKKKLLNAEEMIYTNGVATILEEPKNKKDRLPAHTLRMMQMDETGLWVSQLPEAVQELDVASHTKNKKAAARLQKAAVTAAQGVVKEVFKNADSALKVEIEKDRQAVAKVFGETATSETVAETPKKEEKADNSAALAASKAQGDVNKKVSDDDIEVDGQIIGEYEGRETYGEENDIAQLPLDSLQKWMKQDPEWAGLANEVNRSKTDVVYTFGKVTGAESRRDPTVIARDFIDENGKPHKRTAGGLFQMVEKSRDNAIASLNEDLPEGHKIKWPSKKELGTVKGIKTQIRVAGRLARLKLDDLLIQDEMLQSLAGESAINRVYKDARTGEYKYESKFSAVVNAWGPGTGDLKYEDELFPSLPKPKKDKEVNGYINLRARAIVAAQKTGTIPVHETIVFASGEVQDFNNRNSFVKSTKAEKKIEKKVAEEMKEKSVTYRYGENKQSIGQNMSTTASTRLGYYFANATMSKVAFSNEKRKTAPALALI